MHSFKEATNGDRLRRWFAMGLAVLGTEQARRMAARIHLGLALAAGLLVALICLLGSFSLLVQAEKMPAPPMLSTATGGAPRSLDDVLHDLRTAYPAESRPWRLVLPTSPGAPVLAQPEGSGDASRVAVDTRSGQITESGGAWQSLSALIIDLHTELAAGSAGRGWVAVSGAALMASIVTGLFLVIRTGSLKDKPPSLAALQTDPIRWTGFWHRWAGLGSSVPLLVIAVTGLLLIFTSVVERDEPGSGDAYHPTSSILRSQADSGQGAIGLEAAVAMARGMFRNSTVLAITTPRHANATYRVQLCRRGESCTHHVSITAWIDQYSGAVLASDDHPGERSHVRWLGWHEGANLGFLGRIIWFAAGAVPAFLFGTGIWLWLLRRRNSASG